MLKRIISLFFVFLFTISTSLFIAKNVEAQTSSLLGDFADPSATSGVNAEAKGCASGFVEDPDTDGPCITEEDLANRVEGEKFLDTRKSLNSSTESMSETLGNSGCSALGGAVGDTLSSLGQQLLNGTGINGLGSSAGGAVSNTLGGGAIGNAAGRVAGGIVNNATNAVNQGVSNALNNASGSATGGITGAIQAGTSAIVGGADKLMTSVLSSDLLSGAASEVSNVLVQAGIDFNSPTLLSAGNTLGGMSAGYTAGELGSMFGSAGSAIPGIGTALSFLGGGSQVPTDPQTIVPQVTTLQKDTAILKTKETCLNRLAYKSALITRAKMETNIMKWLNTGNNGNPLYVTNMNDELSKSARNQTRIFVSDLSKTNSPYKNENIKAVIASQQSETASSRIAKYEDPLTQAIGATNAAKYRNGDNSVCPTIKCFVLASKNNVAENYLRVSEDLGSAISNDKEITKTETKDGVLPIKECLDSASDKVDGACRKTKIITPGSAVKAQLEEVTTSPLKNAGNINADSNETISSAELFITDLLTSLNANAQGFFGITDTNMVSENISQQELASKSDVIKSIDATNKSLVGYIAILDEMRSVLSEAATTTSSFVSLGPVTYCPSNFGNQSAPNLPSFFDRINTYNQAVAQLGQEITIGARTMIKLSALKTAVSSGRVDYQSAAKELVNISTSNEIPSSDIVTKASAELSQAKTIRDTTTGIVSSCQAEHREILAAAERARQNQTNQTR